MKTCGECRFFCKDAQSAVSGGCHYNPPMTLVQTLYYNQQSGMNNVDTIESWWPSVTKTDWCGKWQKKTRDQVADEAARALGVKV